MGNLCSNHPGANIDAVSPEKLFENEAKHQDLSKYCIK